MLKEWCNGILPEMVGDLLVYKDHMKRDGSCGVRIFENSRVFLIVLTELKNNTGPSVTNAVENIVNQLCPRILATVVNWAILTNKLGSDDLAMYRAGCTFVFVERYEVRPNELDWIELKHDSGTWHSPNWRRANSQETTFLLNLLKT